MKSTGAVDARINEMLDRLTPVEKRIANTILKKYTEIINTPIDELARMCNTSKASVVRLCKTLGYSGYKQLCVAISVDEAISSNERNNISDITPGDSVEIIANNTCKNHIKTLQDCLAITDIEAMEKAVDYMVKAKRVDFYGVGSSGLVALDAQNKFLRINKTSMSALDPHLQMLYSSTLTKDDVVVLISYTGETKDILNTLNIVKELGVTSIAITRYGGNSLSENADIALTTISNETFMRSGAMTSRIGQLYLIDVLYTSVASKMYDEVKEHLRLTANYSKKTKKKIH